jgi:hypothetical protein
VFKDVSLASSPDNQQSFKSVRTKAEKLASESVPVVADTVTGQLIEASLTLYNPINYAGNSVVPFR